VNLEGGCQCGNIRYLLHSEPIVVYACHCTDCQKQSSSAFGTSVWIARDDFELTRGKLSVWQTRGDSGSTKDCTYCPDCGSRIYHAIATDLEIFSLKGGSLDGARTLQPAAHIWLRSAQEWVLIDRENQLCYQTEPDSFDEIINHYRNLLNV
jgi:hypothetical protein